MTAGSLPDRDVVLVGIGHTNAHVLRRWRMTPIPGARLTCVSDFPVATYSGMLPGVLAGQYHASQMEIDLVRLCASARARLIVAEVSAIDPVGRTVHLEGRPPVPFDVLSIGIGSTPSTAAVVVHPGVRWVPTKPMQTLLARLSDAAGHLRADDGGRPLRVAVVGGGAASVELALCLPPFLSERVGRHAPIQMSLITADGAVPGRAALPLVRRVGRLLAARGVEVVTGRRVVAVHERSCTLDDGVQVAADLVVWSTEASAPPLLARTGLPLDERGFILTDRTLRSVGGAPVFAVGDSGSQERQPTPKAGVYAVRQGPVLWENIQRVLEARPLVAYAPQRRFLKLLNTGDGGAVGEWHGFSFAGRWAGRLKRAIDDRFIAMYQDYRPMDALSPAALRSPSGETEMRCLGCGGKVGGSILSRALGRLDIHPRADVLEGLHRPGDAAVFRLPEAGPIAASVDFFAAPLDDPYLVGRVAALNAASDLQAAGATPRVALATVVLPPGPGSQQEELLYQVLAGGLRELDNLGVALVGGHTVEGDRLAVGYALLGAQPESRARSKAHLTPGDVLILTRAIGTGVLLAAHMRARCRWPWYGPLVEALVAGNAAAARVADAFGLRAVTDVTGFGLAGHLAEMVRESGVNASMHLATVPLLPGAAQLLEDGVESTLAAANELHAGALDVAGDVNRAGASYRMLFDPQTGGGLLLAAPAAQADAVVARLRTEGCPVAGIIGEVTPAMGVPRIRVS
ncbi:MAG: selenide, water dikinase SelD [Acidobacteriota bacterium]